VETEASRAMLETLGCDVFQGYLCSKPLPAPAFMALQAQINGSVG
jgi:EAL domain-containing protein (putative c-di-GMP-specific phosphodiesterase class I)